MDIAVHRRFNAGMAEQFLQNLRLHTALNCPSCIGMAKRVHTETLDSVFITDFVKMGVIAAILTWLSRQKIDKD